MANHVSLADALLIGSATDRMVRFLLFRPYYEIKWLNWFFKRMHAIPVAAGDSAEQTEASLEKARQQIRQGHIVCIFAELPVAGLACCVYVVKVNSGSKTLLMN